ncbi:hypothetical protein BHU72_01380 [Desulfuribacillus stibiiarsenatis]|uniref:Multidrug ABC transporter ATP-binding protein n=1 Tax=Desulfuribacillus stibiiarsenatis TaxID=1390249 RepID=A0A1E5LA90_9FIRM|nr:ABC transporter ATP-binding protein [Desulfuribacillus stibiiarsenatis]OEH86939.1 hypothetical protein BHU72_01380 [Desulfuribacillus stibiiarsenatis]
MLKEFKTMFWFLKQHYHRYILGIIAVLIVDGLQLLLPRILGQFTDEIQSGYISADRLNEFAFKIIGLAIGIFIFRFFWRFFVNGAARFLEFELRNMLVAHFLKLSPTFYNQKKTGDLMAHATNDIKSIRMAMGPAIILSIDAVILGTATIVMMILTVGWKLTLIALLPMPFLAIVVSRFGKLIHNRFRMVQEAFSDLTDVSQENIAGIRVVKSFAQEQREIERFQVANRNKFEKNMHLTKVWGVFDPLVEFIAALSFLLVLAYGSIQVLDGNITLGDFVAFYGYLALLTWPMMAFGWVYNMLQRGSASLARINALLAVTPDIADTHNQELSKFNEKPLSLQNTTSTMSEAPKTSGTSETSETDVTTLSGENQLDIDFRNVTFSYGEDLQPVLKNVSFTCKAGTTTAILGKTGCGKSTIINLLVRQYNPPQNSIFIGGQDIFDIPLAELNSTIGYVPQDSFLFSTTIQQNIAFGAFNSSIEEIQKAAYIADIHENILELPDGYDTLVGERGVTLSGGQKQRISIARAIIRNPQIFVMDDSLSAVDTQTEERILSRLKDFMKDRTTIIIAHRISTVQSADLILFLEDGAIVEHGTHQQLLDLQGRYYHMYHQQQLEQQLDGFLPEGSELV